MANLICLCCFLLRFPEELNGQQCYDSLVYGILERSGFELHWAPVLSHVVALDKASPETVLGEYVEGQGGGGRSDLGCGCSFSSGNDSYRDKENLLQSFALTTLR